MFFNWSLVVELQFVEFSIKIRLYFRKKMRNQIIGTQPTIDIVSIHLDLTQLQPCYSRPVDGNMAAPDGLYTLVVASPVYL